MLFSFDFKILIIHFYLLISLKKIWRDQSSQYAQTPTATPTNLYTNYHFLRSTNYGSNVPENTSATQPQAQASASSPSATPNYAKSFNDQYHSLIMPSSSPAATSNQQATYTTYSAAANSNSNANNTTTAQKNGVKPSNAYISSSNYRNHSSASGANGTITTTNNSASNPYDRILSSVVNQNLGTPTKTATTSNQNGSNYLSNYTSVYDTINNSNNYSTYLQNELKAHTQQQALLSPNYSSYSRSKSVSINSAKNVKKKRI